MPYFIQSLFSNSSRLMLLSLSLFLLSGCSSVQTTVKKDKLVVWGLEAGEGSDGLRARVKEFERRHPDVEVSISSMGAGGMNPQKLMTAIVGNVPPDLIRQDRFTIGDWASRDAFLSLDSFYKRDRHLKDGIHEEDFYPACWKEANYTNPLTRQSSLFAIPDSTDDRALFYNKKLFREAGIVDAKGEPVPPQTWDELMADAKKLTIQRPDGNYDRIGFIPNYGNAWLYIYAWQNDGEFMSVDGRTCTMNAKPNVEALEYMVKIYDALGGVNNVSSFQSGFQSNELDPFLTGKVAMKIDGSWVPQGMARYGPDLDFGVVPAPVPTARLKHEGKFKNDQDTFITWAGGFSFAIPRGSHHAEVAWEFIKWMSSTEAALLDAQATKEYNDSKERQYVPSLSANRKVNAEVFAKYPPKAAKFRAAMQMFTEMMDHARFRPVTFAGQRLWDEHVRAFENATHHDTTGMTPQKAMDEGTQVVQRELDKVFAQNKYKVVPNKIITAIVGIVVLAVMLVLARALYGLFRLRKMAREEATAGYLFALPWIFGFLAFTAGPILYSMLLSFCDYDVLHPAKFVGLNNYSDLMGRDSFYLTKSLGNVAYLAIIGIPLGLSTSLAIAMLLNAKVSGMSLYRTFFYVPSIVPIVASAVLWAWILNGDPNRGLINAVWQATLTTWFGWTAPGWVGAAEWAKPALIVVGLWGAGSGMILWLAGLQGIPVHLYEAADLDGAGIWARFRHVTLPMLYPYIFFNLIMGTIAALQQFDGPYVLTGGDISKPAGPVDSLLLPVTYLFKNAFQYFKMGYASALAWILFAIILVFTVAQLKLASRWVYYESEK